MFYQTMWMFTCFMPPACLWNILSKDLSLMSGDYHSVGWFWRKKPQASYYLLLETGWLKLNHVRNSVINTKQNLYPRFWKKMGDVVWGVPWNLLMYLFIICHFYSYLVRKFVCKYCVVGCTVVFFSVKMWIFLCVSCIMENLFVSVPRIWQSFSMISMSL